VNIARILGSRSELNVSQEIPAYRMSRIQETFRRRLSDSLEDVLYRACTDRDLRTAHGVFAVLEDLHTREGGWLGADRRISKEILNKARQALERCQTEMQGQVLHS
jgi:hypothetical protein